MAARFAHGHRDPKRSTRKVSIEEAAGRRCRQKGIKMTPEEWGSELRSPWPAIMVFAPFAGVASLLWYGARTVRPRMRSRLRARWHRSESRTFLDWTREDSPSRCSGASAWFGRGSHA